MRKSIDEKLIDEKVERFDDTCMHPWMDDASCKVAIATENSWQG